MIGKNITQPSLERFCRLCYELSLLGTPADVKKRVAEEIMEDIGVKEILNLMYNPLIKFNIKIPHDEITVDYSHMLNETGNAEEFVYILNKLYYKRVRNRQDRINMVWQYIRTYGYHMVLMIRKNLDLGFAQKSAQDLGIIDAHSPQKGVVLKDVDDISYPTIAEYKYNGSRLSISHSSTTGRVVCKLRQGNVIRIPLLEDAILANARFWGGKTLDGELVRVVSTNALRIQGGITEEDRIELSGRITSATSKNTPMKMEGFHFVVYDILETENFVKAIPTDTEYSVRRSDLELRLAQSSEGFNKLISLSRAWLINNPDELARLMKLIENIGGEGVMIKHPRSTYDYRKNKQWHKLKHMKEADFKIVGFKQHSRRSDWIGSLECVAQIDGEWVRVMVGSGLNDTDRHISFFENYLNKIVMITYMDMVQSNGAWSVTNPRIVKDKPSRSLIEVLRPDGNNINY